MNNTNLVTMFGHTPTKTLTYADIQDADLKYLDIQHKTLYAHIKENIQW